MALNVPSQDSEVMSFLPLEYGDVESNLPKFTEAERGLRMLELSWDQCFQEKKDAIEGLSKLKGSFALRAMDELVADYVMERVDQDAMSPIATLTPPLSREHIDAAVRNRLWGGVADGSSEKFALTELLAKSSRLKFQLIQHWITMIELSDWDSGLDTGLTDVGKLEFTHVMPTMAAADRWFLKMCAHKSPFPVGERKQRGFTNPVCVVIERNGEPAEVPFYEAFPEEFEAMDKAYEGLINALQNALPDGEREADLLNRKISYYTALRVALESGDIEDWYEADALLPQQIVDGRDAIHIHPIETGYFGDSIARIPEISLRVPDQSKGAQKAQRMAEKTKEQMMEAFGERRSLNEIPAVQKTRALLARSNAVLRHFMGIGFEHHLKPAGQILPNEPGPRAQGGVDSSLDIDATTRRWIEIEETVKAAFGKDFFETVVLPRKDIHREIGVTTASHELGHSVGILPDTYERLGGMDLVNTFIEEWKATAGGAMGTVVVPFWEMPSHVASGIDQMKDWIISKIAMACRYAKTRNSAGGVMYFRKSMMLMKLMEEADILVQNPEGNPEFPWTVELSFQLHPQYFFKKLYQQYREVLKIYGEGSEDDLRDFLSKNLQPTPFTTFLCERIAVPNPENHTIEQITHLPPKVAPKPNPTEIPVAVDAVREAFEEVVS